MATTRNAQRSGDAARERILEIALRLFGTRGYRGTSLAVIAKEAGLSQAGLLHHFPSKGALLEATLGESDRRGPGYAELLGEEEGETGLLDVLDRLEAAAGHGENRALVQLAHMVELEAGDPTSVAGSWARDRLARLRGTLVAATRRSLENADIRLDADPQVIAGLIIAALEGFENQWLIDPCFDRAAGMRAFTAMLRAQLRAPARVAAGAREP